jgi:hypothetical protein
VKALKAFEFNLERSRHLVTLYLQLKAEKQDAEPARAHKEIADLLRAAFVLAVGAFDAYMHDKISENFVPYIKAQLARDGDLTKYQNLQLENKNVLTVRILLSALTKSRPFVAVRKVLDEYLFAKALQNPGAVIDAGSLLGIPNLWNSIYTQVAAASEQDLKDDFAGFARRRNQIVHEGDRQQAKKVKGQRRTISAAFVNKAIDRIESVVKAIDKVFDDNIANLKKQPRTGKSKKTTKIASSNAKAER